MILTIGRKLILSEFLRVFGRSGSKKVLGDIFFWILKKMEFNLYINFLCKSNFLRKYKQLSCKHLSFALTLNEKFIRCRDEF